MVLVLFIAACAGGPDRPPVPRIPSDPRFPVVSAQDGVKAENARPGDRDWKIKQRRPARELAGFADRVSVLPGESFRLFVSTTSPAFVVRAYRVGWYGGAGARKIWQSGEIAGERQAAPRVIEKTGTVTAAHWKPSLTIRADGWPEGSYLLRLDASAGAQRYVPITVRSRRTGGRVVVVNAVTTWQAYNRWGGRNLYNGPPEATGPFEGRSRAVTFDRPYDGNGARLFFAFERAAIVLAERSGIPLAYATDLEVDRERAAMTEARALVFLGHDEYWSKEMRDNVARARDNGTNLAFLGANSAYWRIRLRSTPLGRDRLIVCYKNPAEDPLSRSGADDGRVTGLWRAVRPESLLTGPMYDCFPANAAYVIRRPRHWIFAGTGVRRGSRFPGVVGIESDRITSKTEVPRPIEVIAESPLSCGGRPTVHHSAYYTTPSGAGVFNAGTMRWICALKGRRCGHGVNRAAAEFTAKATTNVLQAFAEGPAGRRHLARNER